MYQNAYSLHHSSLSIKNWLRADSFPAYRSMQDQTICTQPGSAMLLSADSLECLETSKDHQDEADEFADAAD
ncbi:MAG TPA: hypothetical protein VMZ50_02275, partial [Phycisphaerae bacterium]|nr:hypothetical protein [Phycisphaerae bacterium]